MAKSAATPPASHRVALGRRGLHRAGLALALACGLGAPGGTAVAEDLPCSAPLAGTVLVRLSAEGLMTADGAEVVLAGIAPLAAAADAPARWSALPGDTEGPLRLLPTAPADRYGRIAGLVFDSHDALLQAGLVRDGAAIVRPGGLDEACARALLAIESAARSAGAGLWGDIRSIARAREASSLLARNGLYVLV